MSLAMEQIVDVYVRLKDRYALEKLRNSSRETYRQSQWASIRFEFRFQPVSPKHG